MPRRLSQKTIAERSKQKAHAAIVRAERQLRESPASLDARTVMLFSQAILEAYGNGTTWRPPVYRAALERHGLCSHPNCSCDKIHDPSLGFCEKKDCSCPKEHEMSLA